MAPPDNNKQRDVIDDAIQEMVDKISRRIVVLVLGSAIGIGGFHGSRDFRPDPFTGADGGQLKVRINRNEEDIAHIHKLIEGMEKRCDKIDAIQQTMLHRMGEREKQSRICMQMINRHLQDDH